MTNLSQNTVILYGKFIYTEICHYQRRLRMCLGLAGDQN